MSCPHTQQVLARHHDGDLAAPFAGELSASELQQHLHDCEPCQRDLRRARRLDAALAAAAGRSLQAAPERLEALLLAAATPRPAPTPARPRRRLPFGVRLGLAAAGLCALFALARAALPPLQPVPPQPAPLVQASPPATAVAAATPPADPVRSRPAPTTQAPLPPPRPALLRPARTRAEVEQLAALLLRGTAADGLDLAASLPPADAVERRLAAAACLLDGGRDDGFEACLVALAGLDAGPLLQGLVDDCRRRPQLLLRLRAALRRGGSGDGGDALAGLQRLSAAARLGDPAVDRDIAWLLRRQPQLLDGLVAALRCQLPRPARAALLLTVWGDLVARGELADDDATALRLFAQQPAATTGELLALLDRAAAPERRRALLALGVLADPQAIDRLLQALQAPLPEAVVAAWALAGMPVAALTALPLGAIDRAGWLLRAALTQAGVPGSKQWLEDLDLDANERGELAHGRLSLPRFTVAARWFRERHAGQ